MVKPRDTAGNAEEEIHAFSTVWCFPGGLLPGVMFQLSVICFVYLCLLHLFYLSNQYEIANAFRFPPKYFFRGGRGCCFFFLLFVCLFVCLFVFWFGVVGVFCWVFFLGGEGGGGCFWCVFFKF